MFRISSALRLVPVGMFLVGMCIAAPPASANETGAGWEAPSGGVPTDSDGDGQLDAPDTEDAIDGARRRLGPVEDLSQRTESSTVLANPDGTFTLKDFKEPVRVKRDGEWSAVDLNLSKRPGGSWVPKVSPVDIAIGGGSPNEAARVSFDDDESIAVTWPEALPEPTVHGGVATYKLSASTDLVVAVTGSGVTTRLRLNEMPADDDPVFRFGLRTDSVDVTESDDRLEAVDEEGKKVGGTSVLVAWDSDTDAAGEPTQVVPLSANLNEVSQNGDVTTHELELSAPDGYLSDPSTSYPVTIDPDLASLTRDQDTWVREGDLESRGTESRLIVGKINASPNQNAAQSYIQFTNDEIAGKEIISAELGLWQYYAYSCTARRMNAFPVSAAWSAGMKYPDRPGVHTVGDSTYVSTNRGATDCASGWTKLDVTKMAGSWADGTYANRGIRLTADLPDYSSYERRFCSSNPDTSSTCSTADHRPYLEVTYLSGPANSDPVTLQGAVQSNGAPQVGVAVRAQLSPSPDYLAIVPDDEQIPTWELAPTATDAVGHFTLVGYKSQIPPLFVNTDGSLNIDLAVAEGSEMIEYHETVPADSGVVGDVAIAKPRVLIDLATGATFDPTDIRETDGGTDDESDPGSDEPEPGPEPVPDSDDPVPGEKVNPAPAEPDVTASEVAADPEDFAAKAEIVPIDNIEQQLASAAVAQPNRVTRATINEPGPFLTPMDTNYSCKKYTQGQRVNKPERFISIYNWSGAKANVRQTTGTRHSLGVGIKGSNGWYAASYSATVGTNRDSGVTSAGQVNKTFYNKVDYVDIKRVCVYDSGYKSTTYYTTGLRVSSFFQPQPVKSAYQSWHYNCDYYTRANGITWTQSTERSYTKAGGVNLGIISLDAQSGYNKGTYIEFPIERASYICPNKGTSAQYARAIKIWSKAEYEDKF